MGEGHSHREVKGVRKGLRGGGGEPWGDFLAYKISHKFRLEHPDDRGGADKHNSAREGAETLKTLAQEITARPEDQLHSSHNQQRRE
jgi:hypothetical protein